VAEKCIDLDSKIYDFGSPVPTPVAVNLTVYLFRFHSAGFRYFQGLLDCAVSAAPVSIHTAILASSPLSTMEPDVRGLRAVALIGGVVNNKETGTISA
jgi:hypothetical protein